MRRVNVTGLTLTIVWPAGAMVAQSCAQAPSSSLIAWFSFVLTFSLLSNGPGSAVLMGGTSGVYVLYASTASFTEDVMMLTSASRAAVFAAIVGVQERVENEHLDDLYNHLSSGLIRVRHFSHVPVLR